MLTYTPYDGSSKPFTIGLSPLDENRWIEPDADLPRYLDEKARLVELRRHNILRWSPESVQAQQECLDMLVDHMTHNHGHLYSRKGGVVSTADRIVDIADTRYPPIFRAGSLIQDDLVILQKRPDGWTITAAHLAFPSSWSLAEKFSQPMDKVHEHVPGFQAGTRNATIVNRIFDNLLPEQPAERFNWSVNWTSALYHPPAPRPLSADIDVANAIIRVERQTLRKLPKTGAIVFTIRIYLDPIKAIATGPGGTARATVLAEQLQSLDMKQAEYKGLTEMRQQLVDALMVGSG
ncbi:heme-dependent oxidative N-demethylase family protein [Agrobacterium sp. ES01]|uniref:heme-dependent oxidative N-demethylase family protein n=1 Tax=Agrobacterium sp. ES01 TaxID=3420714 RepID=UPI003D12259E